MLGAACLGYGCVGDAEDGRLDAGVGERGGKKKEEVDGAGGDFGSFTWAFLAGAGGSI